jgi:CelD/BcsL family acetyltransferase involved in cellulose biosynthesis
VTLNFVQETFESLDSPWGELQERTRSHYVFTSPAWTRLCHDHLDVDAKLLLSTVRENGRILGIAPLAIRDQAAVFIGTPDVCDYLDCIVEPGREATFYPALLDGLLNRGLKEINLLPLRPDSSARQWLPVAARDQGWAFEESEDEVSVEMDLPSTWEAYLDRLDGKQRHEIRRKLRRLEESGPFVYRTVHDPEASDMATFLRLMRESRPDKDAFLTQPREAFFKALVTSDIRHRLSLSFLEIKDQPAAGVLCFEDTDTVYLYNSGYSPTIGPASTGLDCKLMRIREGIETGKRTFDFLKGDEDYKFQLGGSATQLYRCRAICHD